MEGVSLPFRPAMIVFVFLGVIILILGALSLHAITRERNAPTWKGTIASPVASSTTVALDQSIIVTSSFSTTTNQSEILVELNRYWLERVNVLRRDKQLSILVSDTRLIATSAEWATEMMQRGEITHERRDGKTMHQWIDTKGLDFTERNSEFGWRTNYFVENIARFYAEPTIVGMETALDRVLEDFLSEGPGGAHYESIYYPDWNSVGLGYAFQATEEENARVYFAFHYGSLELTRP